jgi:hypothetical protein
MDQGLPDQDAADEGAAREAFAQNDAREDGDAHWAGVHDHG